eukprot:scaffold64749_cov39-Prasinocladus_malaysianus.AAC.1
MALTSGWSVSQSLHTFSHESQASVEELDCARFSYQNTSTDILVKYNHGGRFFLSMTERHHPKTCNRKGIRPPGPV